MQQVNLKENIKRFVENRVARFKKENSQLGIMLHLIPISSFENQSAIDVGILKENRDFGNLPLLSVDSSVAREAHINDDGLQIVAPNLTDKKPILQLFTNLSIECSYLKVEYDENHKHLFLKNLKKYIDSSACEYIKFIRCYDNGPIYVFLNISNTSELRILLDPNSPELSEPTKHKELKFHHEIRSDVNDLHGDLLAPLYKDLYREFDQSYHPNSIS